MSSRPWWLAQLWVGATLLVGAIGYYLVISLSQPRMAFPSIQFFVTAGYVAPGLAFSFGLNGLAMARRRAQIIRPAERVLLVIEFVAVALLLIFALVVDQRVPGGIIFDQSLLGGIAFEGSLVLWAGVVPLAAGILIVELTPVRSSVPTIRLVRRP